jgi:hypothetical protein
MDYEAIPPDELKPQELESPAMVEAMLIINGVTRRLSLLRRIRNRVHIIGEFAEKYAQYNQSGSPYHMLDQEAQAYRRPDTPSV